jgi:hypothetical protein
MTVRCSSKIGKLDSDAHHVAFDQKRFWLCSEPRQIEGLHGHVLPAAIEQRLDSDPRRFRDGQLTETLQFVENILERRHISIASRTEPIERLRDPRLQRLADISLQYFGAQLFVVQRREAEGSP